LAAEFGVCLFSVPAAVDLRKNNRGESFSDEGRTLSCGPENGIPDWGEVGRASEGRQFQRKLSEMPRQPRLNGNTALADLLFGFQPVADGIAFASGRPALQKNLVRPLADQRVRTYADAHGFLLPL